MGPCSMDWNSARRTAPPEWVVALHVQGYLRLDGKTARLVGGCRMIRVSVWEVLQPSSEVHHASLRMETPARRRPVVSRPGQLSPGRLLRVHAPAAPRPEALSARGTRAGPVRRGRPVRLARHGVRGGAGTASRTGAGCAPGCHRPGPSRPRPVCPRHRPRQAERQPLLAPRTGRKGRFAAARALCRAAAAGPGPHPGRQGPPALDAVRRQRPGARPSLLAQFLHGPRPGTAGQRGAGLHPPIAGRVLRGAGRRTGRPAPRRLPHPPTGEVRQWLWRRGAAAELDDSLALGPEAIAQRGALLADLPTVRLAARGRAPRLPGGRVAPAALPWQPVVLAHPGLPQVARRV